VFPGGVGVKCDALPAPLPPACLRVKATGPRSRAPVAITKSDSIIISGPGTIPQLLYYKLYYYSS
jgi:hypothetical protein